VAEVPLPDRNVLWPPQECKEAKKHYDEWGAWFSGDPQQLRQYYQVSNGFGALIDPKQYPDSANNLLDQISKFFWGNPPEQGNIRDGKLHIPLAGDIASTSADLLYTEPPAFTVVEDLIGAERTQGRLDKIVDNGMIPALLESAEVASAMGGVYLRLTVDPDMANTPLFDVIPPESAVPMFRSGRLQAVIFWRKVGQIENSVFRHLELHEVGRVWHGLYQGSDEALGERIDLRAMEETSQYFDIVGEAGFVETFSDGLTAEYIPNMRPNRVMKGSPFGRSDYQGIEATMDALDEVWSSLMRDVRLGKSRLIVPESYLESNGVGRGARFSAERELFTPVKAMPDNEGVSIEQVQFTIRVDEHLASARMLAAQALRGAGYSAQTFGEGDQSGPATATEIQARESRSYTTRDRKIGYQRPAIARLARVALQMDKAFFGSDAGDVSENPNLEWPDGVQTDMETTSKVVQMLDAAKAVSSRTKIEMVHPQWDTGQVQEEIELIEGEATIAVDVPNGADQFDEPEMTDAADTDEPAEPAAEPVR
jgi:A118 family predicted phage portal protein